MRIVEDLPAPLGPRKPNASPRHDVDVDAVDRDEIAEALHQSPSVDQRFVSHARNPNPPPPTTFTRVPRPRRAPRRAPVGTEPGRKGALLVRNR